MSGSDSTYAAIFGSDGASVLERVLLAIIEAHPGAGMCGSAQERLDIALEALLGTSLASSTDFNKALVFVVRERQRDICNADMFALVVGSDIAPPAVRSVRDLAETAVRDVLGLECPAEDHNAADLLFSEYGRQARRHAVEGDSAREAVQDEAVRRILAELAEWDGPAFLGK